jgi:endonuclease YncB( thermonuclease family)
LSSRHRLVFVLLLAAGVSLHAGDFRIEDFHYVDWSVPHQIEQARIQYVYDGDTIQDRYQRRIRLLGVNTPELANPQQDKFENEPGAIESTRFTERLVRGKTVYLVIDPENGTDRYGRTLAVVFAPDDVGGWICVNWELVREGFAETMLLDDNRLCRADEWTRLEKISRRRRVDDFLALAQIYEKEGRRHSAVETYQQGIRRFPRERPLYENLGRLYSGMDLPGFTVDICLAYLERDPGDAVMRYRLAKAYEEMTEAAGIAARGDYRRKAREEWSRLVGTEFEKEARAALDRLKG